MLHSHDFLKQLSGEAIAEIARHAGKHRFSKGEVIIHKGQKTAGAYLVESGQLRIFTMDGNGNEKPIYQLDAGEICILSINAVLKQSVYPAWVSVETDQVVVRAIPASTFRELYNRDATVRDFVLAELSECIFGLMGNLEEAAVHDVDQRINSYLVRSCPQSGVLRISHQEIAARVGTAREVVSRHLKKLEKEGQVKLSRLKIELLDPVKLAQIDS
ncbi:Crp/Fnr family transcriptional regulator [Motiliproteus coralliicola]|uniref:Crp/Fnr family transcriptional regulator n=1 Tax=Motiliproteus coralliicola TaxID=2283196 RepID=A0A369WRG3_9GAMM|nr:Crp/Fnr family transcriptional regulator [Motiliproteus coralliicola]RDE24257.1 Crp/Fnr family transcriptional regulator [Motiliproteus coralliicola]